MAQLKHRLKNLEKRLNIGDRDADLSYLQMIVRMGMKEEFFFVEPCDTDAVTFGHIQKEQALARGDFARYRLLNAQFPDTADPPVPTKLAGNGMAVAAWRMTLHANPERNPIYRAVRKAVAKARARVAQRRKGRTGAATDE